MFSSLGWGEIFVVLIAGLIIIGPERLPAVVTDVKAAIIAARRAINNVKQELDSELGSEFQEFVQPIGELAKLRAMGPKAAITKTLLDGDDSIFAAFDPKTVMNEQPTAGQAQRQRAQQTGKPIETAAVETTRVQRQSTTAQLASQPTNATPQQPSLPQTGTGQNLPAAPATGTRNSDEQATTVAALNQQLSGFPAGSSTTSQDQRPAPQPVKPAQESNPSQPPQSAQRFDDVI
ncbi:Sec-independent protein translocase protein TatB [Corynebacterium choanae]|uniref:Sec-independent protein translocase protein TatB n=1 Tax=Corynebacterium choanae TaxID=1862358 RepID=UPI000F516988|nr:Sec-independent protein translocase protein TatB [Corynebacterium choanae]